MSLKKKSRQVNKEGGFKDFGNNVPHRSFWCALPSLVVAGCCVTKEVLQAFVDKGQKGEDTAFVE